MIPHEKTRKRRKFARNCLLRYPTEEYWVAKDYHHVYEKYLGEIVDYIEGNETCEIKGDTIIVKKETADLFGVAS